MSNCDTIDNLVNSSNNSANYGVVCSLNTNNKILNDSDLSLNGNGKIGADTSENVKNKNKSSLALDITRFTLHDMQQGGSDNVENDKSDKNDKNEDSKYHTSTRK